MRLWTVLRAVRSPQASALARTDVALECGGGLRYDDAPMAEYRRAAHTVYSLHYHFVFITKYRKPVLVRGHWHRGEGSRA